MRFFKLLFIFAWGISAFAQESLQTKLEKRLDQLDGRAGIYVQHFEKNLTIAINADTLFPTASLIKIPILLKTFDLIEKDSLKFRQEFEWHPEIVNYDDNEGILVSFKDGRPITLSQLISLMITYSDNHASLWLQKLATGSGINEWLDEHGFVSTRVNSRTPGREEIRKIYGWGQTTPREMAKLLIGIRNGEFISKAACEEMYRSLIRIYWDDEALSQIPPTVNVASKQGAVSQSRSEVVYVHAPSGEYAFCIMTKNQNDKSWEHENAGYVLIRDVSRMLWQHFEPESKWQPAPGSERYY